MAGLNLHEIRDYLVELAKEGGQVILRAEPSSVNNTSKKNSEAHILPSEHLFANY